MSEQPIDGDLAWAIQTWQITHTSLERHQVESLTRHLTEAGFTNKKPEDPFDHIRKLRPTVERMFKGVDEFLGGTPRATAADPAP